MQRLDAPIRGYAWGSRTAIAALQGRPASGGPEAELWMGAHPGAPAVLAGTGEPLDAAIAADPDGWLGADVARGIDAVEARIRAAVPIARVIYLEPAIGTGAT